MLSIHPLNERGQKGEKSVTNLGAPAGSVRGSKAGCHASPTKEVWGGKGEGPSS